MYTHDVGITKLFAVFSLFTRFLVVTMTYPKFGENWERWGNVQNYENIYRATDWSKLALFIFFYLLCSIDWIVALSQSQVGELTNFHQEHSFCTTLLHSIRVNKKPSTRTEGFSISNLISNSGLSSKKLLPLICN